MKLALVAGSDGQCLACEVDGRLFNLNSADPRLPTSIRALVETPSALHAARDAARSGRGHEIDPASVRFLPPIGDAGKILCVGLNYVDHAAESPYDKPDYPVYFARFNSGLVGHGEPLVRPRCSEQFDYEGEMVAVIGRRARNVSRAEALSCVAGYSIFNDGSIRDYQFKGPQWTLGKNFDGTGAFGPWYVPAGDLPEGGRGLRIRTRLNGEVMQDADTSDLIFDVAEIIARASEAMTLEPGDVLVTGTPAGVGFARKPPVFMKHGDVCEVEIEGIGVLRNPVRDGE